MKKIILLLTLALMSSVARAQEVDNDELSTSYNFLSIGVITEQHGGVGGFATFDISKKLYDGLSFEIAPKARYVKFEPVKGLTADILDAGLMLGLSYQCHVNEKFAVIPVFGVTPGVRFWLDNRNSDNVFVMSADIGLRLKMQRVAFIYNLGIGMKERGTSHSFGLAFGF